jgi:hypothetical protein
MLRPVPEYAAPCRAICSEPHGATVIPPHCLHLACRQLGMLSPCRMRQGTPAVLQGCRSDASDVSVAAGLWAMAALQPVAALAAAVALHDDGNDLAAVHAAAPPVHVPIQAHLCAHGWRNLSTDAQQAAKGRVHLAISSRHTHKCMHMHPTLAAILSRSIPTSIFSFIATSYLRLSSRMVGSYLA